MRPAIKQPNRTARKMRSIGLAKPRRLIDRYWRNDQNMNYPAATATAAIETTLLTAPPMLPAIPAAPPKIA